MLGPNHLLSASHVVKLSGTDTHDAGQCVPSVCAFVEHDSNFVLTHVTSCDIPTKCQACVWHRTYRMTRLLHAQDTLSLALYILACLVMFVSFGDMALAFGLFFEIESCVVQAGLKLTVLPRITLNI